MQRVAALLKRPPHQVVFLSSSRTREIIQEEEKEEPRDAQKWQGSKTSVTAEVLAKLKFILGMEWKEVKFSEQQFL